MTFEVDDDCWLSIVAAASHAAISAMLAEFSARFPEVMSLLLHERDAYLAWSLSRSKAVSACRCLQPTSAPRASSSGLRRKA